MGIAFGKDAEKQRLGTVLVSSQVICYEPQRVGKRVIYRGPIVEPGRTLLNRFSNVLDWRFVAADGSPSSYQLGPVLSGEQLIDDRNYKAQLFKQFPQAIGGEMEAAGVYASSARFGTEWIVVKAICDWADGNKLEKEQFQPLAAAAAVSLVQHVLSRPDALPETESRLSDRQRDERHAESESSAYARLREACTKVTGRAASLVIDNQLIIPRAGFQKNLDEFLASGALYCFLLGPSGVGKSVLMAVEALRLFEHGWTSLFLSAASFSVDRGTSLLAEELSSIGAAFSFRQIIELLTQETPSGSRRLAILIDAVDIPDLDQITSELSTLHGLISDIPIQRMKVIISCRDISWDSLSKHPAMPTYQEAERLGRKSHAGFISIEVSDFTPQELDSALEQIGATELLVTGDSEKQTDSHIKSLRDLLKHPATFEHYANLHALRDIPSIQNLTWSTLIKKSIEASLKKATRRCRVGIETLQEHLVGFASKAWERQSRGFALRLNAIEAELPTMLISNTGSTSPYLALLETGVLVEAVNAEADPIVGFRVADAGAYFLSMKLERHVDGRTINEFREIASEWLKQTWNYAPLLDAILAWIDRLVDDPYDPRLLTLLELIVKSYHFHRESLFRLMRPAVIASMFEIVKRATSEDFYSHRDAAREIRSSPEAVKIIRDHVKDPNVFVRQLATELVGIHGDIDTLNELVGLFQDVADDVRHEVYGAFRRIGKPAIDTLLKTLCDPSQPPEVHRHCLSALRGAGYRDDRISTVLRHCLQDIDNEDSGVLQSAFLAAAYFRDLGHTASAVKALTHESQNVIQAAAKYLTEVPDPTAFEGIQEALRPKQSPATENRTRRWLPRQLIAALVGSNREKAAPIIIDLIRAGLQGQGELYPIEAISTAKKFGPSESYAMILDRAVSELQVKPERIVCVAAEMLGETWRFDDLDVLVAAGKDWADQGVDLSRLFADAVARGMEVSEGYRLGDQLSQISDLRAAAKTQAATFVPEASRLLTQATTWGVSELCELLWVSGDYRAEKALIHRLENPVVENSRGWYERSNIARALGTCATTRGSKAVFDYLRSEESISLYFYTEALCPLVRRKMISTDDVARIAEDEGYPPQGRTACVLALSELDGAHYRDLFVRVANSDENELLQRYAARMLGLNGNWSVASILIQLLRASKHAAVQSQAAECLGWLDIQNAVQDVERALHDSPDAGFIHTLARFQQESSLSLIIRGVTQAHGAFYRDYLEAVAAFWNYAQGRAVIDAQIAEWARGASRVFDAQTPLVKGLLRYAPNILLERASWLIDHGYMGSSARSELAGWIPHLYNEKGVDKKLLMQTVERLVCDHSVSIRERTVGALDRTSPQFCQQLHSELVQSSTGGEWQQACALYVLSSCGSDESQIERARFNKEFLVRRAADEALTVHQEKLDLQKHIEQFLEKDGLERLTAYLCLQEHGNLSTVLKLNEKSEKSSLATPFIRSLRHHISERLSKEYKERQEKEDKLQDSRGTVWYD